MNTTDDLITRAKNHVLSGVSISYQMATDETFGDGLACEAMFLDPTRLVYATQNEDRCHVFDVQRIEASDYGAVVVHARGGVRLRIGRGTDQMVQRLKTWHARVLAGEAYVPVLEAVHDGAIAFGQVL